MKTLSTADATAVNPAKRSARRRRTNPPTTATGGKRAIKGRGWVA